MSIIDKNTLIHHELYSIALWTLAKTFSGHNIILKVLPYISP